MADKYRRELDKVGLGGVNCKCCNMYKGKERRKLNKLARTRLKRKDKKDIDTDDDTDIMNDD